jgi:hypothetical protein
MMAYRYLVYSGNYDLGWVAGPTEIEDWDGFIDYVKKYQDNRSLDWIENAYSANSVDYATPYMSSYDEIIEDDLPDHDNVIENYDWDDPNDENGLWAISIDFDN